MSLAKFSRSATVTAIVGFVIGLACGAVLCWILLALVALAAYKAAAKGLYVA